MVDYQLPTSKTLHTPDGDKIEVSVLLLSMAHLYEKYTPNSYLYGAYLMGSRLLETSVLVFFNKRSTKTTIATSVSILSLAIQLGHKPWRHKTDNKARWVGCEWRCERRTLVT